MYVDMVTILDLAYVAIRRFRLDFFDDSSDLLLSLSKFAVHHIQVYHHPDDFCAPKTSNLTVELPKDDQFLPLNRQAIPSFATLQVRPSGYYQPEKIFS